MTMHVVVVTPTCVHLDVLQVGDTKNKENNNNWLTLLTPWSRQNRRRLIA